MLHQEFIDKVERNRKIFEFWSNECQDLTEVAKKFGMAKAVVASNAITHYRRHKDDCVCPELGALNHDDVSFLIRYHNPLRSGLIESFSKNTPLHARASVRWARSRQKFMADVFDALGIDHITIDGMEFVHWKYSEK